MNTTIWRLKNALSSDAKTSILLRRFAVCLMNDVAEMAIEGIFVEGMASLVFQAHVESGSQELFF